MDIVKIGLLSIAAIIFAIQFKQTKPEFSFFIIMAAGLLLFTYIVSYFFDVIRLIDEFNSYLGQYSSYLHLILKVVGITYICEFCSNLCTDAGYGSVASQIELCGKISIFVVGLPILLALMETVSEYGR